MIRTVRPAIRSLLALSLATTLSSCIVDTSGLAPPAEVGSLSPAQFCAGDTLVASFDITAPLRCPAGLDCSMFFPNVDVDSNPVAFAPARINDYAWRLEFAPPGDRVDVTFAVDRNEVLIPTEEVRGGRRVFRSFSIQEETVRTATKITGTVQEELIHDGMCLGSAPVNATAELPGPPRLSPQLIMTGLCNASSVPVIVTLESDLDAGNMFRLAPGECVPADAVAGRMVAIRPEMPDLGTRCGLGVDADIPPRPLRTSVQLACPTP